MADAFRMEEVVPEYMDKVNNLFIEVISLRAAIERIGREKRTCDLPALKNVLYLGCVLVGIIMAELGILIISHANLIFGHWR